jgi:acetate kinase
MADAILTLNAGSSSVKFALFEVMPALTRIAVGSVEGIGRAPYFSVHDMQGRLVAEHSWGHDEALGHDAFFAPMLDWVEAHLGADRLVAAGHRIVHGGGIFNNPVRLDAGILATLAGFNDLAPLHEPHNLAAVQAVIALRPELPQIGCFDTAFHHTTAEIVTRLPLPRHFHEEGIRRYGFHGLSYEYISHQLADIDPALRAGRVIAAHLGNGASVCAMQNGVSVDSSMGFTALEGVMMGTRTGTIDAGVVLHLLQARGMSAAAVTELFYKKSGLLGVSGISGDMRDLLASPAAEAAGAVDLFVLSAARQAAALIPALGGLDGLIFTAGIGEHAPPVRAGICARLAWAGIEIDEVANAAGAGVISTAGSRVKVMVVPTDEEAMIARHCVEVLGK